MGERMIPGALGTVRVFVYIAPGADPTTASSSWTFYDVTDDVMFRDPVSVSIGRSDEQSQAQPSSCSFTLLNDSGDYTPRRPAGAYYPNMRLGFPVKIVTNTPALGDVTEFAGYVDELAPSWDASQRVPVVKVSCKGIIHRLQQGNAVVQSAATRGALDESFRGSVAAYWPVTDGANATLVGSGLSGGAPMQVDVGMSFETYSGFPGSEPIAEFDAGSNLHGDVNNALADTFGDAYFRCLLHSAGALTDQVTMMQWRFVGGTIGRAAIKYRTGGGLSFHLYNTSDVEVHTSGAVAFGVDNKAFYLALDLTQDGADIDYAFVTANVGEIEAGVTATVAGFTLGRMTHYDVGANGTMTGWAIGHIGVANDVDWLFDSFDVVNAYALESASARMTRVAQETGVAITTSGSSSMTMGSQPLGTVMDAVRDIESTDHGVLFDGYTFGLNYHFRSSRENAQVDLALDIRNGQVMPPFEPLENTRLVVNDVTVRQTAGTQARRVQDEGEPYAPTGTGGVGYFSTEVSVNTSYGPDLANHAGWLLHQGTFDGDRFPSLELDFVAAPSLLNTWLSSSPIGSRVTVTGLPSQGGSDPDLFVEGYVLLVSPTHYSASLNLSPATPYGVGELASTTGDTDSYLMRYDTGGSTLNASATPSGTTLSVAGSPLWTTVADDFPLDIEVRGYRMRVTSISGSSSPQTFTVQSIPASLPSGSPVTLYQTPVLGL